MAEKEYIEREAACAYKPPAKKERRYSTYNLDDAFENGYDEHIKQVEAIPAADVVEVRHGMWISVAADVLFRCSLCDCEVSTSWDYDQDGMFDYCPCCGAKMDGGVNDAAD